jgi:tripartite ATP-independent transporter DctM subunit
MSSIAAAHGSEPPASTGLARALGRIAALLEVYSRAALGIATIIAVACALIVTIALSANVLTRDVAGFGILWAEPLARFAFLWVIWMGISLAVKRESVTVITLVSHRGPPWWRHSVQTFSGVSLALLLLYACWRATEYAATPFSREAMAPNIDVFWFYAVASMALGYYFITLHYAQAVAAGTARLAAAGRTSLRTVAAAIAGAFLIGLGVWLVAFLLQVLGAHEMVVLGVIFVALTMAGTPIVFMLSIVGIIAMQQEFLGLEFFIDGPNFGPLQPFQTTQFTMGLSGGGELLVILMFLIVAEVMNASGMSTRLIASAAALVGHLRGGMAYVAQLTSLTVSGISGSAQADAAIMTPLLVPAMEREGYRRDVAAAVVAGASIKGAIGPLSIMFIVYATLVGGVSTGELLLSGVVPIFLLLIFQAAVIYVIVRRLDFLEKRPFAGMRTVAGTTLSALPVFAIPVVILGGIFSGVFTPTEASSVAVVVTLFLAFFWYAGIAPRQLPGILTVASLETGIVLLLVGDSSILANALFVNGFGEDLESFLTGITDNQYVFLLVVNLLLLAVGIFVEPLPALYILAPTLAPIAVGVYHVDPVKFGLIMVFNLVLGLIHPPVGLVIFLVSSLAKVSVERLSVMILPWLAVSLFVLVLVTYLPADWVLVISDQFGP